MTWDQSRIFRHDYHNYCTIKKQQSTSNSGLHGDYCKQCIHLMNLYRSVATSKHVTVKLLLSIIINE